MEIYWEHSSNYDKVIMHVDKYIGKINKKKLEDLCKTVGISDFDKGSHSLTLVKGKMYRWEPIKAKLREFVENSLTQS